MRPYGNSSAAFSAYASREHRPPDGHVLPHRGLYPFSIESAKSNERAHVSKRAPFHVMDGEETASSGHDPVLAIDPSQSRDGFGWRSKVSLSQEARPNVGVNEPHS